MAFSVGYQIILNTMPVILLREVPQGVAVGLVVSRQGPPLRLSYFLKPLLKNADIYFHKFLDVPS